MTPGPAARQGDGRAGALSTLARDTGVDYFVSEMTRIEA